MADKILAPIHIDMASMEGGALPREWEDFFDALARITNSTGGGLTANRLIETDDDNVFSSVTDFTDYIAGTTGQLVITDNGDGTVTLSFDGGTIVNTTRITAATYSVLSTDTVIYFDTDGNAITASLPEGIEGTNYKLINCGSSGNDLTLTPNGSETIWGYSSAILVDGNILDLHYNATEGWR